MKILVRQEDFHTQAYDLIAGDSTLDFSCGENSFSLPYRDIADFFVSQNHGKAYFSLSGATGICEGEIASPEEIDKFVSVLSKKIDGTVNIEIKKK